MCIRTLVAGLSLLASLPLSAQHARPDEGDKAEKIERVDAAMERARRLAANPMRMILQAGKFRRRVADEAEPTAEPADTAALRRTSARTAAADAPPAPPALPAAQTFPVARVLGDALLVTPLQASVAPMETLPQVARPAALVAAPMPPALAAEPMLLSMTEPDIPERVRAESARVSEVTADLSLRADGSVADVILASPVPRPLQRYITAALLQWRFAPLPGATVHRVQLVFNGP